MLSFVFKRLEDLVVVAAISKLPPYSFTKSFPLPFPLPPPSLRPESLFESYCATVLMTITGTSFNFSFFFKTRFTSSIFTSGIMISAKIKSISLFESRSKNSSAFFPLDAVCTSVAPARKSIDCTSNSVGTSSSINITDNFSFFCPPSRLTFTSLMLLLLSESSLFVCV